MHTDNKGFEVTRRRFLSGALCTTSVFVAGCGGGSSDGPVPGTSGTGGTGGTGPTVPTTGTPPIPVVTPRTLGPEPAVIAGKDAGIRLTAPIRAATGGQVEFPGGASLSIPPGALAADTDITVVLPSRSMAGQHVLVFGPAGLRFATPARLSLPVPSASDLNVMFAIHASALNPVIDTGSEKTNFEPLRSVARTTTHVSFELEHFSFVNAVEAIDAGAYLVTDIPGECLAPGDLLFYLTQLERTGQRQWRPGHVAMLVKDDGGHADNPQVRRDPGLLVESGGSAGGVGFGTIDETKLAYGHFYLGPYRHPDALTPEQQEQVRQYLFSKLGKPYSLMGVQGTPLDLLQDEAFSCVGLCDAALRAAGKGLIGFFNREYVSTPLEFFRQAVPVTEIEVKAGKRLEIPVYGVVVSNGLAGNLPLAGQGLVDYSRLVPYDVAPLKLPADASFLATQLPVSTAPGDVAPGYLFTWFPRQEQIGQVFELDLQLLTRRANLTQLVAAALLRDERRRTIRMKVVPGDTLRYLDNEILDRFVNLGGDGTLVYAWQDGSEQKRRVNRLKTTASGGTPALETILDIDVRVRLVDGNVNNVVLAQFDAPLPAGVAGVRSSILSYAVAAGASPDPKVLAVIDQPYPPAPSAASPGPDSQFAAVALSPSGVVAGTYRKFLRWDGVAPGPYRAVSRTELWWLPAGGVVTRVDAHAAVYGAMVTASGQPGLNRGSELFELRVLDVNSAGQALVAASIANIQNGASGSEVAAASIDLRSGRVVVLAFLSESPSVVDGASGYIFAARINDRGQVVLTRAQSIRGGGLVAQYHEGLPNGQPKAAALGTLPNFWVNSLNSQGEAGGFLQSDGVGKAAIWRAAAGQVVDVHAQLIGLDRSLRSTAASSVARLGENGSIVGAVIGTRLRSPGLPAGPDNPAVEATRNFVIIPG